jgi:hypothetical protein
MMRVRGRALLRGIFLFNAVKCPQNDPEARRFAVTALPNNTGPERRRLDPRRGSLDTPRLPDQA